MAEVSGESSIPTEPKEGEAKLQFKKCLVALVGPPLGGKTFLGHELERRSNFTFLDGDKTRFDVMQTMPSSMQSWPDWKERFSMTVTYQANHERARDFLLTGKPVIVAATYSREVWHEMLKGLAKMTRSPLRVFYVSAPDEEIKRRLEERNKEEGNPSLVKTLDEYHEIKERYKLIQDVDLVEVDTSKPFDQTLKLEPISKPPHLMYS